jgi:Predicted nucleic-acid-binding protein implicated in transcription termination
MKNIPLRKCLATNKVFPKKELFRVVKNSLNGEVELDMTGKVNGRGAYIHMDKEAIEIAKKTKCLDRALEIKIPDKIYDKMLFYVK